MKFVAQSVAVAVLILVVLQVLIWEGAFINTFTTSQGHQRPTASKTDDHATDGRSWNMGGYGYIPPYAK